MGSSETTISGPKTCQAILKIRLQKKSTNTKIVGIEIMKPSYLMELFCYFTFLGYRETFLDLKRLFWGFGVGQTNCQIKMNIGQTICRTKIKIDGYVDRARAGSLGLKIRNWHFFLKNLICTYLKIQIYWMLLSSNHQTGLYTSML